MFRAVDTIAKDHEEHIYNWAKLDLLDIPAQPMAAPADNRWSRRISQLSIFNPQNCEI